MILYFWLDIKQSSLHRRYYRTTTNKIDKPKRDASMIVDNIAPNRHNLYIDSTAEAAEPAHWFLSADPFMRQTCFDMLWLKSHNILKGTEAREKMSQVIVKPKFCVLPETAFWFKRRNEV